MENKEYKIYFLIKCDRMIEGRKPDIVFIEKRNKELKVIDVVIPGDKG